MGDIKRYAKVEKIPGGTIEDSAVLKGVMFNKDVTHPKMKRRIENPRILLLDCNLEYKKGESQTNIEIMNEGDFSKALEQEEAYIKKICDEIIAHKPDLVITEKGVSDLAQHFFNKAGITAIRRLRKSDNLRVARACGATIVNRTDEITEEDIGKDCGLFEIKDRRRVLHIFGAVQGPKGLHHPVERSQQGHPQRGGEEPAGCPQCGQELVPGSFRCSRR